MNPIKQLCGKYILIHIFMMFLYAQFGVNIFLKLNYFNRTAVTTGQWNLCSAILCHLIVDHHPLATKIRKLADRKVSSVYRRGIPSIVRSDLVVINTHPYVYFFIVVVRLILQPPRVAECFSCCLPSPRIRGGGGYHLYARRHSNNSFLII